MTTTNGTPAVESENGRPSHLQQPMLDDLTNWAQDVYVGLVNVIDEVEIAKEARADWDVANTMLERYSSLQPAQNVVGRRYGYALALEALAASPEAVSTALRLLRDLLVEEDPTLAQLEGKIPPA